MQLPLERIAASTNSHGFESLVPIGLGKSHAGHECP